MTNTVRAHIYVKGDVIGVGFRAWTKIQAKIYDLKGWVRNNFDKPEFFGQSGGVDMVVSGPENEIKNFIEIMKKGSPISHVTEVDVLWLEPKEGYESFEIRPSAHTAV